MRNSFLVLTLFFCLPLFIASCGSSKHATASKLPGTWQAQPIVVDGDGNDWPAPYPNYDSKSMIGYATSNDKDYLYLTIETGDEYTQTKILKAGMTVYIDTNGDKEQKVAIHYPMSGDDNPLNLPSARDGGSSKDPSVSDYRRKEAAMKLKNSVMDATQLMLEGFGECDGGHIVSQNKCGIMVKVGIDQYGELIWEAAIPFKAIYHKDHIEQRDAGRPISVCFAIKGFKKPSQNSGGNESSSSGGGMGNSGMGGGGHGGRGGRGGGKAQNNGTSPRDQLFESTKTWKRFGLAYQ